MNIHRKGKLLLIIAIILLISSLVYAKLSNETLEIVDDLRWKHYNLYLDTDGCSFCIEWNRDFLSMWVKDGILYVTTQDGKWFIEMEKMEE